MADKYYVYRPLLDLIKKTEGTAKPKREYNETLGYGAYTGGQVSLVTMTLNEVDALQTKMLRHPNNKWNSSAAGAYQIVRTTRRSIESTLKLDKSSLFDADMQDRMACYLLGLRGIDKYLSGRLSEDTLIENLAKEWASLPTLSGKGNYKGQNAAAKVAEVRQVLAQVRSRHLEQQPKEVVEVPVEVEVETPVVPHEVEEEVEKAEKRGWWQWLVALPLASIGAFFRDYPEVAWAAAGGIVAVAIVSLIGGRGLVQRVKEIAEEIKT